MFRTLFYDNNPPVETLVHPSNQLIIYSFDERSSGGVGGLRT
jgi:hypothetical protein